MVVAFRDILRRMWLRNFHCFEFERIAELRALNDVERRLARCSKYAAVRYGLRGPLHLEMPPKLLKSLERVLADFSKGGLKSFDNQVDFDSAMPRFRILAPQPITLSALSIAVRTSSKSDNKTTD